MMERSGCRFWLSASALVLFITTAFFIGPFSVTSRPPFSFNGQSKSLAFHAPRNNVWSDLDADEARRVLDFLYHEPNDLNLTKFPTGSDWENVIVRSELLVPNKTDVIPYLDSFGDQPARWARVTVSEKARTQARIAEYMVGPLGNDTVISVAPLTYCYNSGKNYVDVPAASFDGMLYFGLSVAENISDITMDLLGAKANPKNLRDPNGLLFGFRVTNVTHDSFVGWAYFVRPGARSGEWSLLPQGIYVKCEGIGRDRNDWRVLQWAYNGVLYESEADFRAAWKSSTFVRLPPSLPGPWVDSEDFVADPADRDLPPPVMIQPHGPRYHIDIQQNYLEWMGFTLFVSSSYAAGISLHDVRFDESRLIYSIDLQEAFSHYSGSDPIHGGMYWFDTLFGMGFLSSELIPGYDCPIYAQFLNTSYHVGGTTITNKNAICVFEYTADYAMSRHTTSFSSSASRNTFLVLRTVATVGNYDYTIDFQFFLDGTMAVQYRASGYIYSAFYPPFANVTAVNEFGYRIHDAISSSMHAHVLSFRVDLDIAGTNNTLDRIKIEPLTTSYPWDQPEHPSRSTMHLVTSPVEHEGPLNWDPRSYYVVRNTAATNAWGESQGYRIVPGPLPGAPVRLPIANGTSLGRSARWADADLFVLRQHDAESAFSAPLSYLSPDAPWIDFGAYLDGESTLQTDIVLCVNLGSFHVPTTQDVPNTLMHTSGAGVMFVPFNYFEREPSRERVSGVRIDERGGAGGSRTERRFGGHYGEGEGLEPDLSGVGVGRQLGPWSDGADGEGDGAEAVTARETAEGSYSWLLPGLGWGPAANGTL